MTIANGIQAQIRGSNTQLRSGRLSEPTFVFDFGGDKTHLYPYRGLNEFGPFDSEAFAKGPLYSRGNTQGSSRGWFEGFISSFRDGVKGTNVFSLGFVRNRLTGCTIVFTAFDGNMRMQALTGRHALTRWRRLRVNDLGLVITSEERSVSRPETQLIPGEQSEVSMGHGVPFKSSRSRTFGARISPTRSIRWRSPAMPSSAELPM